MPKLSTTTQNIMLSQNNHTESDVIIAFFAIIIHSDPLTTQYSPIQLKDIRLHVVDLLPQVTVLNGMPVSAKEKVLSSNMHGADAEALRTIRRK